MNYYTADLHLGHANIIGHSKRPFSCVEEMNDTIIQNWRGIIKEEDDVYILGDMIFRDKDPVKLLSQLTGKLHLIKGNHDKFIKNPECRKYFESVNDILEVNDNGRRVVLFHYPMVEWDAFYQGSIHLYGHIHNNDCQAKQIMDSIHNCYNVGMDCLNFVPMTLDQIIKFYKEEK